MQYFDEARLVAEIGLLAPPLRVAFAAACAERQLPAYRRFEHLHGRPVPNALELALQEVWADPTPPADIGAFEERIETLMDLVPQDDNIVGPWTQDTTNAQNAGMAALYALHTKLRADPQEAASAALVAYEALEFFVIDLEDLRDASVSVTESRVRNHPLVQAELARQSRDIADLKLWASEPVPMAIARLRARAVAESLHFFSV